MKIFLLGSTGKTGLILLKMLIESGNSVTAYVRSPEKILFTNENLNIIKGDLLVVSDMAAAMANHEVVVSCLGGNENDKRTAIKEMTQIIVSSMKINDIRRIVSISTAGIHNEFSFI